MINTRRVWIINVLKAFLTSNLPERVQLTFSSGQLVLCDTKTDGGRWIIFQRCISRDVEFSEIFQNTHSDLGP